MNLSSLAIKRPVGTVMILLIVVVLGMLSVFGLPLDLMPEIEMPLAMVMTSYSNCSPEEVESMVTETVESALSSVEGLDTMISYSMEGTSIVMIQFDYDTDMNFATLNMREKIALISDYLPDEASEPMVLKMDMNMMPVMQIFVSSDDMNLADLDNTIEDNVISRFERANGVASAEMMGGVNEEIAVKFNQEEMNTYGLSLTAVSQLLSAENINLPSGNVNKGSTEVIVRTIGEFDDVDDIKNLPLTVADRSIVRLGDIATITQQYQEQDDITRVDGNTAIGVMISKQSDANTVEVSDAINKTIKELEKEYPQLNFVVGYDGADYIRSSITSVAQSAIIGAILAVIVVFLFLRNIRTTLIIAISIPTSLLAALAIMDFRGMTLNMITLCALTICIGMLVDNSIVVLENIFRLRQAIPDADEAARKGSKEVLLAVVASTLTTIMVFVPIALSDGMASLLFTDFCWTIVIALVASLLVAVTVIPMLCSKIMRGTISTEYVRIGEKRYKYRFVNKFAKLIEYTTNYYEKYVRIALKKRKKVIASCIIMFFVSLLLLFTLGFEMLPETDEGMISVTVSVPYGTSLEDTDKIMSEIEDYVLTIPELNHVAMSTGSLSGMSLSTDPSLTLVLVDRSQRHRTSSEVADEIESQLAYITAADISASASSSMSMSFGDADVSLKIKGKEIERLQEIGYDLEEQVEALDCVTDADLDISDGSPEVKVIVDRNTAANYGVSAYQLATGLSNAISGKTATKLNMDGDEIEVNLSLEENISDSIEDMKQITIMGSTGQSVPVGQIATFVSDNAPTYIYRENQENALSLNVNVDSTSATGGAKEVVDLVEHYQFPDGYYVDQSGSYDEMIDTFGSLFKALLAAVALVFLLLAAQFESTKMSFVVMMSVPFAMTGAFIALFLTGTSLCMTSFLGLIMLVGTVVNNSILLVEFIRQYEDDLGTGEALVMAGKLRLRPILMSSVTTVVGMIPMSLGLGDGGEMLAPLAIAMIGGLIASTIVTLFLIPVLYSIIHDNKVKRLAKLETKNERIKEVEAIWNEEDAKDVQ